MQNQEIYIVSQAIRYIEEHLERKIDLENVASALNYSKYYLHRIFVRTVGLTIHDYIQRRQFTKAAKLLAFSKKPIMEIALESGCESQQAFTDIFKKMYKVTPARYRKAASFYPLQLEMQLKQNYKKPDITKNDIRFAALSDVNDWMDLVCLTVDGYPCLNEREYLENLYRYISDKQALILRDEGKAIGIMGFSTEKGSIDFLAIHPQYRILGMEKIFIDKLMDELIVGKEISLTTYRKGDRADTGYRKKYISLGFQERELLTEYGYPTQRFVLSLENRGKTQNEEISK